ncbi:OmpW/AlkL family protein [Ideonella sp.]|uniref:OmpW/AlkL family protein n=1 Tax=Ideonella sp. TaxID=1929293 RepID=UPI002B48C5E1|nr:OmpW family outer membrane protein [Ideonella sp.]HJV71770.1 OmpW family outer membrane protein [Ideonella sp.]
MKRQLVALAAIAALSPLAAQAQDTGDWIVRARAVSLSSENNDDTGLDLSINDKVIPEVDISYFLSPNFALELILTYPQKHDVKSAGAKIGTFKHLPPTLTAQYHFTGMGWRPYVGLGLNYTHISDVNWDPAVEAALQPSLKKDSFGLAAQIGADVPVGGGWLLNVDVKKVQIGTEVSSFGAKVGDFKVDPWLVSVGFGKRF